MDEQELDEQFEATDYDEDGNIKQTPPPPAAAKKKRITVTDLSKAIDDIRDVKFPETLNWLGELAVKLEILEETTAKHNKTLLTDGKTRLDNTDMAIAALVNALRQHLEEAAAAPPETKPETEFAQPPARPEQLTATKGDIESVASVCQSLTDVLMVCRALKAVHDLSDEDRLYILQVACRAAGELITNGLKIRAGIKYVME